MELTELYQKVFDICVGLAVFKRRDVQEKTEKLLPDISEFSREFLAENRYGIEQKDYQLLQLLLIDILKDINQGIENRDAVLLEDTVEFGLKPFLELFFEEEELMAMREAATYESHDI